MLILRDFITLDRSDELYRKHNAEGLRDVMAFLGSSLYLEIEGGRLHELIPRETPLGVRRSELFTTTEDRQSAIKLVLVAEDDERGQSRKRVRVEILDIPPQPAGFPKIELTLEVGGHKPGPIRDELTIWATDTSNGQRLRVEQLPLR